MVFEANRTDERDLLQKFRQFHAACKFPVVISINEVWAQNSEPNSVSERVVLRGWDLIHAGGNLLPFFKTPNVGTAGN